MKDDTIRTAEYFERSQKRDELLAYPDDDTPGGVKMVRASELDPEHVKSLKRTVPGLKARVITNHKVHWYKIIGDQIADDREWLGSYVPIIRVIGEETIIDGELDRKGHVRALKDAQRMFNYNAVGSVEFGALQSKAPYIGPADAVEGYKALWDEANKVNYSFLPFNHMDDEGEPIPAPTRQHPPVSAPVYIEGMNASAEWMRMVSGQYQADMGAPSNERSGAAINARQRQGDNATFHYLDHQSIAMRFCAKQLLDLIPKIYDTERVIDIISETGDHTTIRIDPHAQEAWQELEKTREEVAGIFNPKVGRYEVMGDVGPAYQTLRQEAWNAYVQILAQNRDLVHIIGDLAFKCADFPGAEEIAERLKRMVPVQALQDGPPPEMAALQQQNQALQGLLQQVAAKLADKTADQQHDREKNVIGAYDAVSRRIAALKDALNADPANLVAAVTAVLQEAEHMSAEGPVIAQLPPAAPMPQMPSTGAPQGAGWPLPPQGGPASEQDMVSAPAGAPSAVPAQ
jgi:hypothetical protein